MLSPKYEDKTISTSTSLAVSALVGWWTFCIIVNSKGEPLPGLVVAFAVAAATVRWLIYCAGVTPPFSVWGRIASRRLILPGFDRVFLTPLAVILVGIMGGVIVRHAGAWYPVAESCATTILWFVLLSGGPTLRNWMLTGQFRFRPSPAVRGNNQMLRRV